MAIPVRHMARVALPDDTTKAMILGMYSYESKYNDTAFNYVYKNGVAYLPPNYAKLEIVANMLGETIVDQRSQGGQLILPYEMQGGFKLREYQDRPTQELINHVLDKKMGTVHAGCGTGKTVVMTCAAGALNRKSLVLVDQSNLKSNWVDAYDFIWGRKLSNLTSTTNTLTDCMITTFQLLAKSYPTLQRVRREYGTILTDECHVVKAKTFKQVMMQLDAQYRLSCTATFNCKAFDNGILEDWTSPICVRMIDDTALIPNVIWRTTGVQWASDLPMEFGNKILPQLSTDHTRNAVIFGTMKDCLDRGRKTVVICVSNAQADFFHAMVSGLGARSQVYTGTTSAKVDRKLKDDMNNGRLDFVFTCKKMDKGTDVERLDTIIMAKPNNNRNDTEQQTGRVRRKCDNKPTPEVHDFIDESALAVTFARNRNRWYGAIDNKGYNITNECLLDEVNATLVRKGLTGKF